MGKHHTKCDLVHHLKGPSSHLVHWLNIIPCPRKISQESINFEKKVLPGIFLGYVLYAGGIWKGDILVVNLEELEEMDASEIHAKGLNAKEVILPKRDEKCKFPVADGKVLLYGGDQVMRTSTLILNQPVRGESRQDFIDESKGSPPTMYFRESYPDAGEARDDFWSISGDFINCHHVEPRVELNTPWEESFPIPLKYVDIIRVTHTTLDVLQDTRIDDYWKIDGARDLSDSWTAFTQFSLQKDRCCPGGD